jgi:hypothetical protein
MQDAWIWAGAVRDVRNTVLICSALLIPLYSCTVGEWIVGETETDNFIAAKPTYDYTAYFASFDNPWVGRSRDELVDALGPPYAAGNGATGHCIDAYVVDEPTSTVIKYYCR